ncbi:MAG: hypothetical protein V1660_01560 [archaeon]
MGNRLLHDKRGDLLKFVINLLIGIFCVIILLYLFSGLLSILFPGKAQQKLQAQGTIDEIYSKVDNLEIGKSAEVMIYSPEGFYLMGFATKGGLTDYPLKLPPACINSDCLCVCQWAVRDSKRDCIKNAACKSFDLPFFDNERGDLDIRIIKETLIITKGEKFFTVAEKK